MSFVKIIMDDKRIKIIKSLFAMNIVIGAILLALTGITIWGIIKGAKHNNLIFLLPSAIISFITAYGLWRMKNWARFLQIVSATFISIYFFPIATIFGILIIYYLAKKDVAELFK